MSSSTPLSAIPTLPALYKQNKLSPPTIASQPSPHTGKISLIRTDITTLAVSAIVNAANTSLLGGGGVDGAIHRAAGPELLEECRTLDGCKTGSAKMTDAYDLPCEKVIHAVGPVYGSAVRKGGVEEAARLLAGCYTTSLDLLAAAGLGSIAFSALSTGVYGYPSGEAAEVAVKAVKGWLDADEDRARGVERVVFCSFLEKDERAYEEVVPKFFPPSPESDDKEGEICGNMDGAADSKKEATVSDLPDVPTDEPKEPGQPDHKKAKLDEGGAEQK